MKSLRGYAKFVVYKILLPLFYKFCALRPLSAKKIVFVEPQAEKITDNLFLLYKAYMEQGYSVKVDLLKPHSSGKLAKTINVLKMIYDVANAPTVITDEACISLGTLPFRKGSFIVQTWHGCGAFKKFGFSTGELLFGYSSAEQKKYPPHRNYAFVTVSSDEVVPYYAEAMQLEANKILPIGVSRTDVFFDKEFLDNAKERVYSKYPEIKNKKIILYAPTFRGKVTAAQAPNCLNYNELKPLSDEGYVILIKQHPLVKNSQVVKPEQSDYIYDVSNSLTIEELLIVSDICVTDYSSLVFEYALFNRPMFFLAYDLEDYFDWRGFYYKYDEFVPGPIVTNTKELLQAIGNVNDFDYAKLKKFRQTFMSACDGHCTEKIMQKVECLHKQGM